MSGDLRYIEREVFIAAAPETVFAFFVEPALIARWIGVSHTLDARPGGRFRVEIGAGNVACGVYTVVDRPHRVAFTWGWEGQAALPPGASLVEIELKPRDHGTLLRLVHSGLPDAVPPLFTPERHDERWAHHLDRLRNVTSAHGAGADKP